MTVEHLVRELTLCGGVAPRRMLPVSKAVLGKALRSGVVARPRPGVYTLAGADEALEIARLVRGARSHRSAAAVHGWCTPGRPEITVRRGSRVPAAVHARAVVTWGGLSAAEAASAVTHPVRTVVDCLIRGDEAEALAIADAAVRSGQVTVEEVRSALESDRRHGVRAARRLARLIDGRAESPLESHLRLIASAVTVVDLIPQVSLFGDGWFARVDLADPHLGIVAEADSLPGTGHGRRWPGTPADTTTWSARAGACCASRTRRSRAIRTGCGGS